MVEPINDLYKICRKYRDDAVNPENWFAKNIKRRISIRFTWLFLILGLSANQATLIALLLGICAGIFFTKPQPLYWFIGLLILFMSTVFDCVDGEIARYTRQSSSEGKYFDLLVTYFLMPYILACMSFSLYSIIQGLGVFITGFLAIIGMSLIFVHKPLVQSLRYEQKLPYVISDAATRKQHSIIHYAYKLANIVLIIPSLWFIPQFLLATILDCFIEPFHIAGFTLNARFLYLVIFAGGIMGSVIVRNYVVKWYGLDTDV